MSTRAEARRFQQSRGFSFMHQSIQSASADDVADPELSVIALHLTEPFHFKGCSTPSVELLFALKASDQLVETQHGAYDRPESVETVNLRTSGMRICARPSFTGARLCMQLGPFDRRLPTGCMTSLPFDPTANWFEIAYGSSLHKSSTLPAFALLYSRSSSDLRYSRNTFWLHAKVGSNGEVEPNDTLPRRFKGCSSRKSSTVLCVDWRQALHSTTAFTPSRKCRARLERRLT
jgi:hypothetical protein